MTIAEQPVPAVTAPPVVTRQARSDFWVITSSHALVDVFPMFITSLMIVLQNRLGLSGWQETAVWVATPSI